MGAGSAGSGGVAVVELRDPESAHVAYLVGTAHVSGPAGQDVRQLLEDVRPQICAVELDKERLLSALRRLKDMGQDWERPKPHCLPDTPWKALKLVFAVKGGPSRLIYLISDSFSSSILGVPYGVDMLSALATAKELGIRVVPIDRPSTITLARCMAQADSMSRASKRFQQRFPLDPKASPAEQRASVMRRVRWAMLSAAEAAGCEDPHQVVGAVARVGHAAGQGQEVDTEDLRVVRGCAVKVVELVRQLAVEGASKDVEDKALPNSIGAPPGEMAPDDLGDPTGAPDPKLLPRIVHMMLEGEGPPALTSERDLILAQNLRTCTAAGPTVAVVGAAHVRGMRRRWEAALSPEALEEAKSYYMLPGRSYGPRTVAAPLPSLESADVSIKDSGLGDVAVPPVPVRPAWRVPVGPVVVTAGFLGLAYYRPRVAGILGITFAGMLGATSYGAASALAKVGRAAARLEEASDKLALEKSMLNE